MPSNSVKQRNSMSAKAKESTTDLPEMIGYRTKALAPLLRRWRLENPDVPWSKLINRALKKELQQFAGKREQHLLAA